MASPNISGVYKIALNKNAVGQMLRSPEFVADMQRRAAAIAAALPTDSGETYTVKAGAGFDRASARVLTENTAAKTTINENPAIMAGAIYRGA